MSSLIEFKMFLSFLTCIKHGFERTFLCHRKRVTIVLNNKKF